MIKYEVKGKEYIKEIRSMSGEYKVGEYIDIIYNSENPDNVNIKPSYIFMIMGIVFSIAGVFLIWKNYIGS